jgi:hypothetical protein
MEFVVQTVDVSQHLAQRIQPVLLVKRPPGATPKAERKASGMKQG